jgi:hypothetical protein
VISKEEIVRHVVSFTDSKSKRKRKERNLIKTLKNNYVSIIIKHMVFKLPICRNSYLILRDCVSFFSKRLPCVFGIKLPGKSRSGGGEESVELLSSRRLERLYHLVSECKGIGGIISGGSCILEGRIRNGIKLLRRFKCFCAVTRLEENVSRK